MWIIVMFLSAVWTLILMAPIHCKASTGEQTLLYIGWTEAQCMLSKFNLYFFWVVNYSFKCLFTPLTHFKSTFLNSRKQVKTFVRTSHLVKFHKYILLFSRLSMNMGNLRLATHELVNQILGRHCILLTLLFV